ncbi:ABC transporter substrate-binding protein [Rhodospirillaceae bacterium KN72]|uniref:ABC transporter substrate-binding protein n=1 Tax=Pacificispira spongiicola TaxID=2729598 RepID=A0A7Y0E2G0_9PROT|nr:ABC transporter substrate-binding protein [Pacificispira spongiicola]NMM45948.1 ABC transporter substrate-binding protein [Pacificispira spongiicola]
MRFTKLAQSVISGAVLAGALAIGIGTAQAADLRIGVEGAYPPFSEKTASGELIGFDIDIANALCEKMGVTCELVEQDWDGIIPALQAKKYDAIVASMSITEDRKKVVDFTKKYYNTPAKFAAKDGMFSDDSPAAMAGKRIGVQRGTIHDDFLTSVYKDSEIVRYATQDEVYLDITAGRIDAMLADSLAIDEGFLKTDAGKGYSFFGADHSEVEYFGEGAGIAIRKGEDELREKLNDAIDAIRADGTYDKIQAKYFDFDIYGG